MAAWQQGMTHNQIFITQSATLQDQVGQEASTGVPNLRWRRPHIVPTERNTHHALRRGAGSRLPTQTCLRVCCAPLRCVCCPRCAAGGQELCQAAQCGGAGDGRGTLCMPACLCIHLRAACDARRRPLLVVQRGRQHGEPPTREQHVSQAVPQCAVYQCKLFLFYNIGASTSPTAAQVFAEAAAREYPTLRPGAIPAEAFPLFLSSRQFLRMLDGEGRGGSGWLGSLGWSRRRLLNLGCQREVLR